ncbi:MAG: leucine-rich repeat domain-containing protein [Clostridia bacterium]|nr:leucine-rich repeat domain-containing protein [Clostridia bacterium]
MKKFASLLLTVALLAAMLCVFAVPASAETDIIENQEGATWLVDEGDDHVWYKLTENDTVVPFYMTGLTLTIGGTGAMPDFGTPSDRPWHNAAEAITTIQILSGVTSIGNYAFYSCSSLTSVTIPASVTSIGKSAFYSCSSLTSVTIPVGVTSIDYGTFMNCSSLTSVTIPASVTSIGSSAFENCSSLTSVTIPASVTIICASAFSNCSNLTNVTVKASTPPTLENYVAFYNTPKLVIYVPYGTSGDYTSDDNWGNVKIREKIREAYIIDDKCTESGTVTTDKDCFPVSDFADGQTVTVTVVPSEGHQLKKGNLLIEYRENGDRKFITPTQDETDPMKYSFIMPAANVIATVCEHDFGNGHICTKCGAKDCVLGVADHTWNAATGKCTVCQYKCTNAFHNDVHRCPDCGMKYNTNIVGSTLSEGSLAIICTVAAAVVFGLGGFFLGTKKKKKPAFSGDENE